MCEVFTAIALNNNQLCDELLAVASTYKSPCYYRYSTLCSLWRDFFTFSLSDRSKELSFGPRREKTCLQGFVSIFTVWSAPFLFVFGKFICKFLRGEISIFQIFSVHVAMETGLKLALTEIPKTDFLATRPLLDILGSLLSRVTFADYYITRCAARVYTLVAALYGGVCTSHKLHSPQDNSNINCPSMLRGGTNICSFDRNRLLFSSV